MASRIEKRIILSDDISGEEAEGIETLVFATDGEVYTIDLTAANATEFREAIAPFLRHARKTTRAHLVRSLKPARRGRPRTRQVPAERERREEVKAEIPEGAIQLELQDTPISAPAESVEDDGNSTPEGRFPRKGIESEALSELGGSPVAPPVFKAPDFSNGSDDDVPETWRPCMPLRDEYEPDAATKAKMWRALLQAPIEKVTPEIMKDWRGFYEQKVWQRAG